MIPHTLSLSGFLSYRDPVTVDFTQFDLACISGHNGAGKSSLLDAITWVLFGQARKRDESLINSHPAVKAAEVTFVFEYEGSVYRIQRTMPRGKTTLLEFHIRQMQGDGAFSWKALTERTQRDTQASIERTLRMDYDTFVNASFFLQGKADQFTQQRPGDRKRILSSILGLEAWEEYRERAANRRKELEAESYSLQGALREIDAELGEEAERKKRLAELEAQLKRLSAARINQEKILENFKQIAARLAEQRRWVDDRRRQVETTLHRLGELQAQLQARQDELHAFNELAAQEVVIRKAYAAWQASRDALAQWEQVAARFRDQEALRQEPLAEIRSAQGALLAELNMLREQQAHIEQLHQEIPGIQEQLEAAQEQARQAEQQLQKRSVLEGELRDLDQRLAQARAENQQLKIAMDELKLRIDQLQQVEDAHCPLCGQPLSAEERSNLIDSLQTQGREMGDRYRSNRLLFEQSDELRQQCERQIADLALVEVQYRNATRVMDQARLQYESAAALLESWEAKGSPRLVEVERLLEEESYCPEARQRLREIDAALKEIGYDAAAHDAARLAESQGRVAERQLLELETALAQRGALEREIAGLEAQCAGFRADADRLQAEYESAAAELAAAEAQAPDLEAAEEELFNLQEQENRLRMEVGSARQSVQVLDDLRRRRKDFQARQDELNVLIGRFKQLERAFSKDGIPAVLIEQALPQIEAKANEILDRISAGGMSVRFSTQAAYKDKRRDDMKETLDILISDGAGVRDYEMYSGGEAFRVNFAIRLALSEILAQRAGARLRTLVIDEGFGSQDAQGRQRLVEAINLVKADFAKILVITHIDELKDAFPARLEVEKTPQGSTVRLV